VEQRRSRRYSLELPLAITRNGPERVTHSGITKNISSGGVLFTTDRELDLGGSIEYVITLGGPAARSVSLRCIGKILRYRKVFDRDRPRFDVAATLERYEFLRADQADA
jgi:hypothetical protein